MWNINGKTGGTLESSGCEIVRCPTVILSIVIAQQIIFKIGIMSALGLACNN